MALENLTPETRLEWFIHHAGQGTDEGGGPELVSVPLSLQQGTPGIVTMIDMIAVEDDAIVTDSISPMEPVTLNALLIYVKPFSGDPYLSLAYLKLQGDSDYDSTAVGFIRKNAVTGEVVDFKSFRDCGGYTHTFSSYTDVILPANMYNIEPGFFDPGYAYEIGPNPNV